MALFLQAEPVPPPSSLNAGVSLQKSGAQAKSCVVGSKRHTSVCPAQPAIAQFAWIGEASSQRLPVKPKIPSLHFLYFTIIINFQFFQLVFVFLIFLIFNTYIFFSIY